MDRPSSALLLLLLTLALALGWLAVDHGAPRLSARPLHAAGIETTVAAATVPAAPEALRREAVTAPAGPAPMQRAAPDGRRQSGTARPALVRVSGQVLRSGQPVPGCDLSFQVAGDSDRREVDWDLTDRDGRYEVELFAGTYVVSSEDGGSVTVVVPARAWQAELVVDLDLPPDHGPPRRDRWRGWSSRRRRRGHPRRRHAKAPVCALAWLRPPAARSLSRP
jgi:hypothetical protein